MRLPERSRLPDNLEIPGLYPPRRRGLPRWPVWLWLVVGMVVAIPVVGIPGVVLARYTTSNSDFCLSCHATGDTPDRGVPSQVHPSFSQVSCVDCHAKPGQIVFEGYIKGFMAEPERVSSNCLRCHSDVAKRSDTGGFKYNALGIAINHQAHLERGATCVTCHSNIAHDLEEPKTNRPRMESCYSCHARTDSCAKCHAGGVPTLPPSRETVGRRAVPPPPTAVSPTAAADAEAQPKPKGTAQAGPTSQPAVPPASKTGEDGAALFAKLCSSCHGSDGSSIPSANLSAKSYLESQGTAVLTRSTAEGKGGMPAFGATKGGPLSDEQVRAIVEYLLAAAR